MQQSFDVLIIGANADGLAAGASLSATGRKVGVLEPTMKVGGELRTESFLTHHRYNLSGGWLLAEKLAVPGVSDGPGREAAPRLLLPSVPMAFLFERDPPLVFYRSVKRLQDQVLRADRDGLARLAGLGRALQESLLASFAGTDGGDRHRLSSVSRLTCRQILDSHDLVDKRLRCALTYLPLAFGFDIEAPGSGPMLALCLFALTRLSIVDGGSGLLAAALADRIIRNRGMILESAKVAKIREDRGARKTVELEDGRSFSARKVVWANDRSGVPGVEPETRMAEAPGDLGPYRIYLGLARKPAGIRAGGDRDQDVNSAYMIAMGFDSEEAIYGYLHAIRAGPPPFVAGHLTSSGLYDPVEPTGALGMRDGRIWCVACHTANVKELRQLPESPEDWQAGDAERRSATGALTWQGILPMRARMIDPEGFRKSFQRACIEKMIRSLDGLGPDDVTFSLTWLPQDTNEPLLRMDLADLMAGTIPHERYAGNQQGVYVNPYASLAGFTGLATGICLAGFVEGESRHHNRDNAH